MEPIEKLNKAAKITSTGIIKMTKNTASLPKQLAQDVFTAADTAQSSILEQNRKLKEWSLRLPKSKGNTRSHAPLGAPAQTGLVSQSTERSKRYATNDQAGWAFRRQSEQLLRAGSWNDGSIVMPSWHLLDSKGKEARKDRRIQEGDVLQIDAPGQEFFVRAERVHAGKENVQFTVRPTANPNAPKDSQTDHFFTDESTRTFTLQRDGRELRFVTEGRNEAINAGSQSRGWKAPANVVNGGIVMAGGGEGYWRLFASKLMNDKL